MAAAFLLKRASCCAFAAVSCLPAWTKVAAAQAGATWGEAKAALEAELSIKAANMRIKVSGAEVSDDGATLEATFGHDADLEVVYAEDTPMTGDLATRWRPFSCGGSRRCRRRFRRETSRCRRSYSRCSWWCLC